MNVHFGDPRLPQRFWDKVHPEPNSGCWLWSGSVAPRGYGQVHLGNRVVRCNRAIAALQFGEIEGRDVCHRCDNPYCCNPGHLWLGSRSDNMRDCFRKGRHPRRGPQRRGQFCKRGHDKSGSDSPHGECRECRRYRQRIEYLKPRRSA